MQESCKITDHLTRLLQDNRLARTTGNMPLAVAWASLASLKIREKDLTYSLTSKEKKRDPKIAKANKYI